MHIPPAPRCALVGLTLVLTACGDSPGGTSDGTSGTQGTTEEAPATTGSTAEPTTLAPTDTGSASTTDDSPTTSTTATGSTTDDTTGAVTATDSTTDGTTGEPCINPLCGEPGVCCAEGEKCTDGACVPGCGATGGQNFLDVEIEWSFTTNEVTVMPLVADIQGDAIPEVVINASRVDNITRELGEIIVLDGSTGVEIRRISHDPPNQSFGSHGLATPVLADVSGDGKPDIIYSGRQDPQKRAPVHAVDGEGNLLWTGHNADDTPVKIRWDHGAAVATNFDDDLEAEIVIGGAIFDHDGLLVWNQDNKGGLLGTPTNNQNPPTPLYIGGLATVADLTGDGKPELITGREAWTVDWTPGEPPTVTLTQLWQNLDGMGNDGWPAIGDIDQNGTPEVVLVAWPDIKVLDGATGKLWCGVDPTGMICEGDDSLRTQPIAIKGGNLGGPATIADLDGDGRPEVGIAGGVAYAVYDFHRVDEEIVIPNGDPAPAAGAMYVRWFAGTQDNSSAATGSSVFDFQGDGAAEVAYQDECRAYVFDGRTGDAKLAINNSSGTVHEYPLIVDADGDEHAEFLVVANLAEQKSVAACAEKFPNYMARKGVFSYRPQVGDWVPTRTLWTQHTYHITNADSAGNPPLMEQDNWTTPGLNNFRQNEQGECK